MLVTDWDWSYKCEVLGLCSLRTTEHLSRPVILSYSYSHQIRVSIITEHDFLDVIVYRLNNGPIIQLQIARRIMQCI
jgi:hypothetical protein